MRRYMRSWRVARSFGWLNGFRGILVLRERHFVMFRAFVHLAFAIISLRALGKCLERAGLQSNSCADFSLR
jgi:hypothetical protein